MASLGQIPTKTISPKKTLKLLWFSIKKKTKNTKTKKPKKHKTFSFFILILTYVYQNIRKGNSERKKPATLSLAWGMYLGVHCFVTVLAVRLNKNKKIHYSYSSLQDPSAYMSHMAMFRLWEVANIRYLIQFWSGKRRGRLSKCL